MEAYGTLSLLFDSSTYLPCQFRKLLGADFQMIGKIEIGGLVERHEVDVDMGHIDSDDGLGHLDARTNLL